MLLKSCIKRHGMYAFLVALLFLRAANQVAHVHKAPIWPASQKMAIPVYAVVDDLVRDGPYGQRVPLQLYDGGGHHWSAVGYAPIHAGWRGGDRVYLPLVCQLPTNWVKREQTAVSWWQSHLRPLPLTCHLPVKDKSIDVQIAVNMENCLLNVEQRSIIASKCILAGLRQQWSDYLKYRSRFDPDLFPLVAAWLLGESQFFSQHTQHELMGIGLMHIMAISGMHIVVLFGLLWAITGLATYCHGSSMIMWVGRYILVSMGTLSFVLLTGSHPSAWRAWLMLALQGIARVRGLGWSWPTVWVTTVLCLLAWHPDWWLNSGFWLSCFCVWGLYRLADVRGRGVVSYLLVTVAWSAYASLISAFYFSCFCPWSGLIHLLVMPVLSCWILPGLLGFLWPISGDHDWTMMLSYGWHLSQKGLAWWNQGSLMLYWWHPTGGLVLSAWLIWSWCCGYGRGLKWGITVVALVFMMAAKPDPSVRWLLRVIDVGQGEAVLVRTVHHALLFDAGNANALTDSGWSRVMPALAASHLHHLDCVIISHPDRDHWGGLPTVLHYMAINHLTAWGLPRFYGDDHYQVLHVGDSWCWDGCLFKVLAGGLLPASYHEGRAGHERVEAMSRDQGVPHNVQSMVLWIRMQDGTKILVAGDHEEAQERVMLARWPMLKSGIDILVVPHHGSRTSSSWGWLQAIRPKLALISNGYRNHFGHPHAMVLMRYHALAAQVWQTAQRGDLVITADTWSHRCRQSCGLSAA